MKKKIMIDKQTISITSLTEDDEISYWLLKSIEDRMQAMELMRQINFNYDPDTERLQRVFEVVERKLN